MEIKNTFQAANSIQLNDGVGKFVEIFHSCESREAKDCKCSKMPRIFLNYESARSLRNALNEILELGNEKQYQRNRLKIFGFDVRQILGKKS